MIDTKKFQVNSARWPLVEVDLYNELDPDTATNHRVFLDELERLEGVDNVSARRYTVYVEYAAHLFDFEGRAIAIKQLCELISRRFV